MWAMIIASLTGLAALAWLFSPRMRHSESWQATVTPLASIIGSGFLVSVPLLAGEVGNWAILAMTGLLVASWLIGSAIRFNIDHAEPRLAAAHRDRVLLTSERLSQLTLVLAYFVSVAYYLLLLATFLLKGLGVVDPALAKSISTAILLLIGSIGYWRGLEAVEHLAKYAVDLKLAVIIALLAGLAWYNGALVADGNWYLADLHPDMGWHTVRVLLGVLIVVQGFETSRFMGAEYSQSLRIRTMRTAQLIAGAIYISFFALVTVMLRFEMKTADIAQIIDLVGHIGLFFAILLTFGALASQFSAGIADSIGAAGLVHEASEDYISLRLAYPLIALVAIVLIWTTDVFGIITLASRAFALFYLIQCLVALYLAITMERLDWRGAHIALYTLLSLLCASVVVFALPAAGG